MVRLRSEVLEQAFGHLRRCGAGRRECVVYLTSSLAEPDLIDRVQHPAHRASAVEYEVALPVIAELFTEMLRARRCVRAQMHTHPGPAYHSPRDNDFALVSTPGYLSIVLPNFAQGPVNLNGAFIAERTPEGGWASVQPSDYVEILR
jgi:hypothetical protein